MWEAALTPYPPGTSPPAICAALTGAQYVKYLSQAAGLNYKVCSKNLPRNKGKICQIGSRFYLLWVTPTLLSEEWQKNPL